VQGSPLEATDPSGMIMSWEMRMPDPRAEELLRPNGPSVLIAGVPYDGNSMWLGGFSTQRLGSFDMDLMLTQAEGGTLGLRRQDQSRPLTENEVNAAKSELPGLNTDAARVAYDSPSDRSAFTPRNTMHFPEYTSDCQDFITCKNGRYAGWFIPEATHVRQYQRGQSPFWGHILSEDVFTFSGDYLPRYGMSGYMNLLSGNGLSTEKEADWHQRHYELCTVGGIPDACAWR
jgi:hypothetical protein